MPFAGPNRAIRPALEGRERACDQTAPSSRSAVVRPRFIGLAPCVAALALALSACSSVTVSRDLNGRALVPGLEPIAHVHASTWGVYLFNLIPIVCGDTRYPGGIQMFSDQVRVERLVDAITQKAAILDATHSTDMTSRTTSWWAQIGLIFWVREAEVSANLSTQVRHERILTDPKDPRVEEPESRAAQVPPTRERLDRSVPP